MKSTYQGKPHLGSSETWDAGCRSAVPKSFGSRLFFRRPLRPGSGWAGARPGPRLEGGAEAVRAAGGPG